MALIRTSSAIGPIPGNYPMGGQMDGRMDGHPDVAEKRNVRIGWTNGWTKHP